MTAPSLRHRFPGAGDGWARFDGPSGTQVVDTAIAAMATWLTDGSNGCGGGWFGSAHACDALVDRARTTVGQLFNADPAGVCFGPNMTTMTFAFSRAAGATLAAGDCVVGTRLDHDANVTPWRRAADDAGAQHVLAPFDPATGTLPPERVIALIDERTKWVTLPGASNLLGTTPDLQPIIEAAHAVGARVFIDAVALAPHRRIDIAALGCDALVCSPYKWYAPHSGMLWVRPDLLDTLPVYKVRPAHDHGPSRFETGMPSYEAIAGVEAAARFLIEEGMDRVEAAERELFAPLLHGLLTIPGVTMWGVQGIEGRTPTAAFTVAGHTTEMVAKALAAERVAVWDGHAYAVEVVGQLGLAASGGVVRAGISRYLETEDVDRLLAVVRRIASR
ncbi:MAG: cysteine desulfurase-like protein [Actinomycetota bacterium]|nr:cysteine desulfurase-like protein [Actinomycetota bacterium]